MRSNPEDCQLHMTGFAPLFPGMEVAKLPAFDLVNELFARLTYKDAVAFARSSGCRLMTTTEVDLLYSIGFKLKPVLIRETPAETQRRLAVGGRDPLELMGSIAWWDRHDSGVWQQLTAWDGVKPVANCGKQWIDGAPKGRAWNYGWHDIKAANGVMWQRLGTRHDDGHTDYSQLTQLVREVCV